ncbi:tripartite tricarboxylate transporter permease, partial [Pseudorhodobacter sp.]|uniref:tripartite tricarboxylate transporter permease n=1 Tax=Pseudorhodobacter sp. TaxID=1934400 RepID=UPI002649ED94
DLNITYSIIWSLALANIMGAGICMMLAQPISNLTRIPFHYLAPCMIALICFAAFQATRDLADLVALLGIGLVGILMKRFGWPRPALLIGFVLAPQAETFFYQALQFNGWGFLLRPGVLIIGAMTLVSVYFGLKNRIDDIGAEGAVVVTSHSSRTIQIAFALAAMVFFGLALWDAAGQSMLGGVFPLGVGIVGAVFGVILLVHLLRGRSDHPAFYDYEIVGDHVGNEGNSWFWTGPAWIGGLVAATALVGFYIAMIGFFLAFLRLRAKASWLLTVVITASAAAFILGLAYMLSLNFPSGWLQEIYDLPWPIR